MNRIQLGSYIYSQSRYRADDTTMPVGGLVIGQIDNHGQPDSYLVVALYRGRTEYFTIADGDAHTGTHEGQINPPVIRDVLRGIATDIVRGGDPVRHATAQTVLTGVLARFSPRKAG